MWKKIRESTSGINLNFISSLVRKRRYAKFETDEDANKPLNGHLHDDRNRDSGHLILDRRDEENNKVSWTSSSCSKRLANETPDNLIVNTSYQRVELKCSDNNGNRNSRRPFNPGLSEPFMADYGSTNIHDDSIDSLYGYGSDTSDNDVITHHEFYEARKNGMKSQSLKDDVSDFVHSLVQKRYQKLDDSADESDDVVDFDRRVSENNGNRRRSARSGSRDSDNQVFHSIKDITPNWEDKPKKSKKRRKPSERDVSFVLRGSGQREDSLDTPGTSRRRAASSWYLGLGRTLKASTRTGSTSEGLIGGANGNRQRAHEWI